MATGKRSSKFTEWLKILKINDESVIKSLFTGWMWRSCRHLNFVHHDLPTPKLLAFFRRFRLQQEFLHLTWESRYRCTLWPTREEPLQRSGEVNREVKFDNSLAENWECSDHLSSSYFHANTLWMKLAMNPFTYGPNKRIWISRTWVAPKMKNASFPINLRLTDVFRL